jgi:hypothetical protein
MNKRGWIRVVEAFAAILLLAAVILAVVNTASTSTDITSKVYDDERIILESVQFDSSLKASVMSVANSSLPINIDDPGFPADVKAKITSMTPGYLTCTANLCRIDDACLLEDAPNKDIYSLSAGFFANLDTNIPRKMVLYCMT